ncbi:hypothetical protein D3C81_2061480 [compost metagenome]
MGRCIGGRPHFSFNYIAVKIDNHHVARLHLLIIHAAGLDYEQAALTVNRAHIAPCILDESMLRQVQIGLEYFFFQPL